MLKRVIQAVINGKTSKSVMILSGITRAGVRKCLLVGAEIEANAMLSQIASHAGRLSLKGEYSQAIRAWGLGTYVITDIQYFETQLDTGGEIKVITNDKNWSLKIFVTKDGKPFDWRDLPEEETEDAE